jgi:hypothetical protein
MSKFAGLGVAVDRPARMTILHPATGQPLVALGPDGKPAMVPGPDGTLVPDVAWIDLISADSDAARAHERVAQNKRLRSRARRLTAEDLEAEGVDLLAALTRAWRLVTLDGRPIEVPCSVDNARELYSAPELGFVRRQVNEFAADLGNFQATETSKT